MAPIALLAELGVNVSIGTNNIQNAFTPLGRPSPISVAWLAGLACHLGKPAEHRWLLDTITVNPARLIGHHAWGLAGGRPADLVVLDGDIDALLASAPTVLGAVHAGRFRATSRPRRRLSDDDVS